MNESARSDDKTCPRDHPPQGSGLRSGFLSSPLAGERGRRVTLAEEVPGMMLCSCDHARPRFVHLRDSAR
ncbi:hypothetical protein ZHAS_00013143 [Anopheles sinensis]|uniref:Uncharacterized protein n=1 Tax=Anopheles sinensis TaxID=74873 RepID=A0A084W4N8_ANOSI|nr:hypothetical protein ZHAS_00013143 [Anopheles sinensis]